MRCCWVERGDVRDGVAGRLTRDSRSIHRVGDKAAGSVNKSRDGSSVCWKDVIMLH